MAAKKKEETTAAPATLGEALLYVYQRVGYVQKGRSAGLRYSFAGEAAMISHVRPIMRDAGLIGPYPVKIDVSISEHGKTRSGAMQIRHDVIARYHLRHALTGEVIEIEVPGEGVDSGDKGTGKAMTGAYKYVLRQLWCLETGDDPDKTSSEDQEVPADDWSDFCEAVKGLGLDIETVGAYCEAKGRPFL